MGPLSSKMFPSIIAAANVEGMCIGMNGHAILQTNHEYCVLDYVSLIHKQAPHLISAQAKGVPIGKICTMGK